MGAVGDAGLWGGTGREDSAVPPALKPQQVGMMTEEHPCPGRIPSMGDQAACCPLSARGQGATVTAEVPGEGRED